MNVHAHLVGALKDRMVSIGLSQNKLAVLSGVPQGNVSAILNGRPASEATWQRLFTACESTEAR